MFERQISETSGPYLSGLILFWLGYISKKEFKMRTYKAKNKKLKRK